jgi:hypothetical protein
MTIGFILQVCQAQNSTINYFNQIPPGDTAKIFAPGIISLDNRRETKIVFSPDCRECLIGIGESGKRKILYAKQDSGKWSEFVPADFITNDRAQEPFFSPDSQSIFFTSHADIYVSTRINKAWTTPIKLVSPINSDSEEYHPTVTLNGTLYFCSKRDGEYCIYRSKYENEKYSAVEKLDTTINSRYGAWDPYIAPDESYVIFTSIYPDGYGKQNQYISFHNVNGTWSSPRNLGSSINTNKVEYGSYISPDKKYYFFSRPRGWMPNDSADIYWINADFIDLLRKANDTNK